MGRGLTLEDAAELIGVHPRHLQRLEMGRANATLATVVATCVMFDMSLAALFADVDWRQSRSPKG
jgi:DNA-binding XRE family transcriptional regulator